MDVTLRTTINFEEAHNTDDFEDCHTAEDVALCMQASYDARECDPLESASYAKKVIVRTEPLDSVRPRVVCLCGSTRFYDQFQAANFRETMAGRIVLSVGFYPHGGFESKTLHGGDVGVTPEEKVALDVLHKRKIDLADEVFVLNVGGYIGDSTRSEVDHARRTGKPIRWLEASSDVREGEIVEAQRG